VLPLTSLRIILRRLSILIVIRRSPILGILGLTLYLIVVLNSNTIVTYNLVVSRRAALAYILRTSSL